MPIAGGVLVGLRLLLAGVFAVAGIGKLADRSGSRRALTEFGVPAALVAPASVLLPIAELAIALTILVPALAVFSATAAFALLLIFIAAIGRSLIRGRAPDCHCFGQIHSEPAGWKAIVRNGLLALVALVVVVGRPHVFPPLWSIILLAAVTVSLWLSARRRSAGATRATAGRSAEDSIGNLGGLASLAVGGPAPAFALDDLDGNVVSLDMLREHGCPVLLLFSDPACGPCSALLPQVARWDEEHAGVLTTAVISRGTVEANRERIGGLRLNHLLLQKDREVSTAYRAVGTPAAVLVHADGSLGSQAVQGIPGIRDLVTSAISDQTGRTRTESVPQSLALAAAASAPDFGLADLQGRAVRLADFRHKAVVVLFWNPACGYCQRMLRHLKAWETTPPDRRPELLVVSTGSVEANLDCGFKSTVALDQGFSAGRAYGVQGTPSAALVDPNGRIAVATVVGAPAILELLRFRPGGALEAGAKPRRRSGIEDELLSDGNIVVYVGDQRRVYTLNATAALIWDSCDGEQSIDAIVADMRSVYPSAPDVDGDVRELLDKLMDDGMIVLDQLPASL